MTLRDVGQTAFYLFTGDEHPVYCQVCNEEVTREGGLRTISDREELSDLAVCSGNGSMPNCFERLMGDALNNGYERVTLKSEYLSPSELQGRIEEGSLTGIHRSESDFERRVKEALLELHRWANVRRKE